MFKKISKFIAITSMLISVIANANTVETDKKVKIYISQGAKHPALDFTTLGIIDGLKEAGYNDSNMDLKVEQAQGSLALANQIATKFASKKPDIVVGVGTMASQAFMKYVKEKKVSLIFTTVTDPVGANLTNSLEASRENVSGVSNYIPLEPQVDLFKQIRPEMKTLGFLYSPSEANSISLLKKLEEVCASMNIKLVTQTATQTSEVMQAATKLASEVDAIFISNDAVALSAMTVIIKAAKLARIPVFVSDTDLVDNGAIAALGPNQYQLGKQTAAMIVRVLKGADIASMPVEFPSDTDLYLNRKAGGELGFAMPHHLLEAADKIFDYETVE
jgi:putative ABC transport system substrate-binding protein